jgi:hypothetical protein
MPFKKTKAFDLGIIDEKGNILKKQKDLKTSEEKAAYGYFERMVWNLKKVIHKVPLIGKSIGSVVAASYMLLKEKYNEGEIEVLKETTFLKFFWDDLVESAPVTNTGSTPSGTAGLSSADISGRQGYDKILFDKKKKKLKRKKKKKSKK